MIDPNNYKWNCINSNIDENLISWCKTGNFLSLVRIYSNINNPLIKNLLTFLVEPYINTDIVSKIVQEGFAFDPNINPSWFIYSNFNKTAEHIGINSNRIARTKGHKSTGKWYVEIFINNASFSSSLWPMVGILNETHYLNNFIGRDSANIGIGWQSFAGSTLRLWHDGNKFTYVHDFKTNDIVMIAFDCDTGDVWFGKNGVWNTGDPPLGTPCHTETEMIGVEMYVAILQHINQIMTIRPSASEFTYSIPTGFSALQ